MRSPRILRCPLDNQPVVDQRHNRFVGQQLLAPVRQVHLASAPLRGVALPVARNAVLQERYFAQVREQREIQRQRKVSAIEPDIAFDLAGVPLIVVDLLNMQMHLMFSQKRAHDTGDNPVLNVFAIEGQREGFQPGGFFARAWTGVMPAR